MSNTDSPLEDKKIVPLPLVIGVTGHLDLFDEDHEPLKKRVRDIFAELQDRCPHTPLVLLSSLAEGADRLVAWVALEKGVRLIVPLPMPKVLYEKDFPEEASLKEFKKLLKKAEKQFELPLLKGAREEEVQQPGPVRDQQYAQLGAYIALHSQVLIALWDGSYTYQTGGTSQIIQFQLQGVPEPYAPPHSPLDEPESGPVYHIVTRRLKNPITVERPFKLRKLYPKSSTNDLIYYEQDSSADRHDNDTHRKQDDERYNDPAEREFDRTLRYLDTFNQDVIDLGPRLQQQQKQSKAHLLGDIDSSILPVALQMALDRYADLFAIADVLALHFKDRTVKRLFSLFRLFFIAAVFFGVFAHLRIYLQNHVAKWLPLPFLLSYLAFLLLTAYYVWFYQATRSDYYKNKYLDYRALAEGLRVQFYWRLAGVPDTVASHYLRKQKSELDWIRNSIRVAHLLCDATSGEDTTDCADSIPKDSYQLLLQHWIDDQAIYFASAAKQDYRKLEGKEQWIRRLLGTGIVLALLLFFISLLLLFFPQYVEWVENIALIDLLIIVTSLVLVLAALREGYADKMAYAEQIKQYQRMSRLFSLAHQRLNDFLKQGKFQEAESVIRELGEEALAENGDWVMLHRARPITVPIGG